MRNIVLKIMASILIGGLLIGSSPFKIGIGNVSAEESTIKTSGGTITLKDNLNVGGVKIEDVYVTDSSETLMVPSVASKVDTFYTGLEYESDDEDLYFIRSSEMGIYVISNFERELTEEEIDTFENKGTLIFVDDKGNIYDDDSHVGYFDSWVSPDGVACLELGWGIGGYLDENTNGHYLWTEEISIDEESLYSFSISFTVQNFREKSNITYDLNGGYILESDTDGKLARRTTEYVTQVVSCDYIGDRYVIPRRDGYTFTGYIEKGSEKYVDEIEIYLPGRTDDYTDNEALELIRNQMVTYGTTYVAQWKEGADYNVLDSVKRSYDVDITNTTQYKPSTVQIKIEHNGFMGDYGATPNADAYYNPNYLTYSFGNTATEANLDWYKSDMELSGNKATVTFDIWKKDSTKKVTGLKELKVDVKNEKTNEFLGTISIFVNLTDLSTNPQSKKQEENQTEQNGQNGNHNSTNHQDGNQAESSNPNQGEKKPTIPRTTQTVKKKQTIKVKGSFVVSLDNKKLNLKAKSTGNGKLSYKSSNVKVASVSKNGVVTIKGVGSTVITISAKETSKFKSSTKKIIVKVNPKKQEFIKKKIGYDNKTSNLKLVWKKDKNADYYQIQRAVDEKFKVKSRSKTIKKNSAAIWLDSSTFYNTEYYFRVRSVKKIKGKLYYGEWSTPFIANFRKQR